MFGFMHTFFVMIQGSLIYQKLHLNRYWRLLLESWVWFHGFSVAVMVASTGKYKLLTSIFTQQLYLQTNGGQNQLHIFLAMVLVHFFSLLNSMVYLFGGR